MKILRYAAPGGAAYGLLEDGAVHELARPPYGGIEKTGVVTPLEKVRLLAPCEPRSIVAVGLNYRSHIEEINIDTRGETVLFPKALSSLAAPGEGIVCPPECTRLDYEAELAVVIGKECVRVKSADAHAHVFGYTCLNDVTARNLQTKTNQWMRAKGYYTFCPVGPWIETDVDPSDLDIRAVLNGNVVQNARTSQMIFDVPYLIEYISNFMALMPGDIIATGTMSGIGPMKSGDRVEIVIEGIGTLENYVK